MSQQDDDHLARLAYAAREVESVRARRVGFVDGRGGDAPTVNLQVSARPRSAFSAGFFGALGVMAAWFVVGASLLGMTAFVVWWSWSRSHPAVIVVPSPPQPVYLSGSDASSYITVHVDVDPRSMVMTLTATNGTSHAIADATVEIRPYPGDDPIATWQTGEILGGGKRWSTWHLNHVPPLDHEWQWRVSLANFE